MLFSEHIQWPEDEVERERRERRERREKNLTEEEVGTMFVERIIFLMIFNVNKLCLVPCFRA